MEDRDGEKEPSCEHEEEKSFVESGINLHVLKKSGKYPCGVYQTGVGSTNAISAMAASAGCIINAVALRDPCALTLSSGALDALGLLGLMMKEKLHRLRLETKSLKLSQSLPWGNALCRRWL